VFLQHPLACLGLARWLPVNVGTVARRHIQDPALLKFIDMECFCWSVMPADLTPMINAGMVFSDRHAGGINYPKGGVGSIAVKLARGLERHGGEIRYKSRVRRVLLEQGQAVGVELPGEKRSGPSGSSPTPPAGTPSAPWLNRSRSQRVNTSGASVTRPRLPSCRCIWGWMPG